MLSIKRAEKQELEDIRSLLVQNQLEVKEIYEDRSNAMIAYDNKEAVATAAYHRFERFAVIKFVSVKKNRQGEYLGDGIVKALLNLADSEGITKVFVNSNKCFDFFKKIGFHELTLEESELTNQLIDQGILDKDVNMSTDLPEFFLKACKSNK